MIYIKKWSLFESKIDIAPETDKEIENLIKALLKNKECDQIDDGYLEIKTPFEIDPDANNKEWKNKIGMVFYPELISYSDENTKKYKKVPWIACRIELEGMKNEEVVTKLLKWLVSLLEKSGYKPFMDEDAVSGHWHKEEKKNYIQYICYVNPDYPKGHWENHAIE